MGRRKIDIQPLTNERNRLVTFQKRKNGLFKKAYELGVLCSVDVAVIIFTPGQNNKLFEFCSGNIDDLVLRRLNYQGERDLKTEFDFINGGGQLKRANTSAARIPESEDDDDNDLSDTKPPKRRVSGTRSRPARATTPNTDILSLYRNDSPQTLASSADSVPRSSTFSFSGRPGPSLDRSRSDDHDYDRPTPSRQGSTIPRPGSSASNPDYRRSSHFSLLRSGLKSDSAAHPPNGSFLGPSASALLGAALDGHPSPSGHHHHHHPHHHSHNHHQDLFSNFAFARHRANTNASTLAAHSVGAGGPAIGIGHRPYPAAAAAAAATTTTTTTPTPPLPPAASLTAAGGGAPADDSWLDFLALPSTTSSISLSNLLADHPTTLGASHASASSGYDFPFGLGLVGAAARGAASGGGGSLGIGSYGLSEGTDLDKERELLASERGSDFGPRKRPRWE